MTTSLLRSVLLTGICLFASSSAIGDEPEQLSMQVLPSQRTPVYVWPIMRVCKPDRAVTEAAVAKLNTNLAWEVHQLAPPSDPAFLGCSGASCVELLDSQGCDKRTGIFIGGEIDEEVCNKSDASIAGCHGQVVTRVRVFRYDIDQNRPTGGEFRYALCQDGHCGAEARSVQESVAQLIEQLVSASAVPSPPAAPRATPLPEDQCTAIPFAPTPPPTAAPTPPVVTSQPSIVAYAYYTQYQHLAGGTAGAEQAAKERASHFLDGATLPPGSQHVQTVVNTKYALLPGEAVVGNAARIGKLQSFLTAPPAGPAYDLLRKDKSPHKALIVFVFAEESKSLATYVIESGKPLRQVPAPSSCQPGSGESPTCVGESVQAALGGEAAMPRSVVAAPAAPPLAMTQRPLGCLPFHERSCTAICSSPPALVPVAPPLVIPPPQRVTAPRSRLRNVADGLLYTALLGSIITATALTIVDYTGGSTQLTDAQGDTANVTGVLRPAEWVAWGLTIGFAIPSILSMADRAKSKPRITELPLPVTQPSVPRCPISEGRL